MDKTITRHNVQQHFRNESSWNLIIRSVFEALLWQMQFIFFLKTQIVDTNIPCIRFNKSPIPYRQYISFYHITWEVQAHGCRHFSSPLSFLVTSNIKRWSTSFQLAPLMPCFFKVGKDIHPTLNWYFPVLLETHLPFCSMP